MIHEIEITMRVMALLLPRRNFYITFIQFELAFAWPLHVGTNFGNGATIFPFLNMDNNTVELD